MTDFLPRVPTVLLASLTLSASLLASGCGGQQGQQNAESPDGASTDFADFEPSSQAPAATPPDRDADGIYDQADACPDVAGVASASRPDRHGCPKEAEKGGGVKEAAKGPSATMVGLRDATPSGAVVYVQLTERPQLKTEQTSRVLTITLVGVSVPRKNNRNPLVATHFDAPVESARLISKKNATELVIQLRRPVEADVQLVSTDAGPLLEVTLRASPSAGSASAPPAKP